MASSDASPQYPDIRELFKPGDRVTVTYGFPDQTPLVYVGTVKSVECEFMVVVWDELNGEAVPPKEMVEWNYVILEGGTDSSPIKKVAEGQT